MSLESLSKYVGLFGNLHQYQNKRLGVAPHKPILLLAVLDEIERGHVPDNFIALTPELVAAFRAYWRVLVPEGNWIERIANPFRFLVQDGFWVLVKDGTPVATKSLGYNPTLQQLTTDVDGAQLAPELWQLLQDKTALHALRQHLLQHHFHQKQTDIQPQIPDDPIEEEIERLKKGADSRYKITQVKESRDETGYYVRHALFPRVVKQVYGNACAVCRLAAHAEDGKPLVDAAHIKPFEKFHNDDPCNGIAFCKNHHWGFDRGWFSLSDTYRVLVSPQLREHVAYITHEATIHLPNKPNVYPAPDALSWHRENVFLK
jgi:putative restriction endonuclease